MFLIFTVPLTLLLFDTLSIAFFVTVYRLFGKYKRWAIVPKAVGKRLLLLTGAYQLGWCVLVLVADGVSRLSNRSNETALQLLLMSSFVLPPVLLLLKHRQFSTNH